MVAAAQVSVVGSTTAPQSQFAPPGITVQVGSFPVIVISEISRKISPVSIGTPIAKPFGQRSHSC